MLQHEIRRNLAIPRPEGRHANGDGLAKRCEAIDYGHDVTQTKVVEWRPAIRIGRSGSNLTMMPGTRVRAITTTAGRWPGHGSPVGLIDAGTLGTVTSPSNRGPWFRITDPNVMCEVSWDTGPQCFHRVSDLATVPFDTPRMPRTFGAIVYSQKTRRFGYSWAQFSQANAFLVALDQCKEPDAAIAVWGQGVWLALATSEYGGSGSASDPDRDSAVQKALGQCHLGIVNCQIAVLVHAERGSPTSLGSQPAPAPRHAPKPSSPPVEAMKPLRTARRLFAIARYGVLVAVLMLVLISLVILLANYRFS